MGTPLSPDQSVSAGSSFEAWHLDHAATAALALENQHWRLSAAFQSEAASASISLVLSLL